MSAESAVEGLEPSTSPGVEGTVEQIVFRNPDDGWCVLKVKVKGRRRLITVVGHSFSVTPGEGIEAFGEWSDHVEFGERFLAGQIKTTLPRVATGAKKYLSSGLVRGIGPELAKRMVVQFGANVFDVIEKTPWLLRDVSGIGPRKAESICVAWGEQRVLREIMAFLGAHGISVTKAPRILRTFGSSALKAMQTNPYRLAREVPGIGFKTADLIARHLQLDLHSEERYAAAIHDRLLRAVARGNCAFPAHLLLDHAAEEVGRDIELLELALENEIESGRLTEECLNDEVGRKVVCIFPAMLAAAERRLAYRLVELAAGPPPWISGAFIQAPPKLISSRVNGRVNSRNHHVRADQLSEKQRQSLARLLSSKLGVLTGGPGTGKTTVIRAAYNELTQKGWRVLCCAPTGRAAQRLAEHAGLEAQTIHRLLGWDPSVHGFRYRSDNPLAVDLLILDESSMVGLELMDALIEALPAHAGLLLVGDADQLPSIQAGRVLESILEAGVFQHEHLTEVFRQSGGQESLILQAARDVLMGKVPPLKSKDPGQDFHFISVSQNDDCAEKIMQLVRDRIPARFSIDPINDIQVICPMNKGATGARALNRRLQAALNPSPPDSIERFGNSLSIGDKVIATLNDYDKDVFNGDIGRVIQIERDRTSLRVDFGSGIPGSPQRRVDFDFNELDTLSLGFAITVHKSQGSEYDAIVIPLMEESAPLLDRHLLYTAITRGKKLVVIVGSPQALKMALRSGRKAGARWSGLSLRLREASRSVNF